MLVGRRERSRRRHDLSGGPNPPPNAPGCAKSIDGALASANAATATQRRLGLRFMTDSRRWCLVAVGDLVHVGNVAQQSTIIRLDLDSSFRQQSSAGPSPVTFFARRGTKARFPVWPARSRTGR